MEPSVDLHNQVLTRWWFQIFFIFTPKIGEDDPILMSIFFSDGRVSIQPPTGRRLGTGPVDLHKQLPKVAVSFLLAGCSSIFNGLCFAELATRLPVSGSSYLYVP